MSKVQRCFARAILAHNRELKDIRNARNVAARASAWEREQAAEKAFRPVWLWAVNRWGLETVSHLVWEAHAGHAI